jgi:hypothetical protein
LKNKQAGFVCALNAEGGSNQALATNPLRCLIGKELLWGNYFTGDILLQLS